MTKSLALAGILALSASMVPAQSVPLNTNVQGTGGSEVAVGQGSALLGTSGLAVVGGILAVVVVAAVAGGGGSSTTTTASD